MAYRAKLDHPRLAEPNHHACGVGNYHRHFCVTCGSKLFNVVDGVNEVEIRVGAFDNVPSELVPIYELWIEGRESWLKPIDGAEQHAGNRS